MGLQKVVLHGVPELQGGIACKVGAAVGQTFIISMLIKGLEGFFFLAFPGSTGKFQGVGSRKGQSTWKWVFVFR